MVKFRTAYDDDVVSGAIDPGVSFTDIDGTPQVSLTVQSEREACDVNVIVERFERTGVLPSMVGSPLYGDFTNLPDYQTALKAVMDAQAMFMGMDAKIRKEFDNDPARFLAFCEDPANGDKLIEWGLRTPPVAPSEGKEEDKQA